MKLEDDYYGELASHPDRVRAVGWESLAAATERYRVVADLLRSGERVLDLGAGLGDFGRYLEGRGIVVDYLGVERDPRLVARGRGLVPEVRLESGDFMAMELAVADVVVVIGALVDGGPLRDGGLRFGRLRRLIERARSLAKRQVALVLLDQDRLEADPVRSLESALGGLRRAEVPWLLPHTHVQVERVLTTDLLVVVPGTASEVASNPPAPLRDDV
jgi:SAM-dependent methyltransferase